MQTFLKIFLSVFIFCLIGACSGEKKKEGEGEEAKAKSSHPLETQFKALRKARKVEKKVQDAFNEQFKQLEEAEK